MNKSRLLKLCDFLANVNPRAFVTESDEPDPTKKIRYGYVPNLTREQAAIIGLVTGFICGPFEDIHELAVKLLGKEIPIDDMADYSNEMRKAGHPMLKAIRFNEEKI